MRGKAKRLSAWACAVSVFLSAAVSARADFSPGWDALAAADAVTLEIDGQIDALDGLADASLEAVNGFLSRTGAEITLNGNNDEGYRLLVRLDGQPALTVSAGADAEGVVTAFFPSDGVYRTETERPDALALLTGAPETEIRPLRLAEGYRQAAPALFAALAEFVSPRQVKEKTSIQYAVSSPAYELYTFPDGSLNAAWSRTAEQLIGALPSALGENSGMISQAESLLRSLTFSGDCRVRRYLDADGRDMGLQFTGRAGLEGDMRKASLTLGYTPGTGGSLEMSLPAVTGKNSLKITLAGRVTEKNGERTLTLSASRVRKTQDGNESASLDVTLKNAMGEDGQEHWSGKGTLTLDVGKKKTVWTFTPGLVCDRDALSGDVAVQRKEGSKTTLRATVRLRLAKAEAVPAPDGEGAVDLRGADDARARAAVMAEWPVLAGLTARMMATLPADVRARLTHDLRTDSWMTGPGAVPLEEDPSQEDSWVVEEEE